MKIVFYGTIGDYYVDFHEGSVIHKYLKDHNNIQNKKGHLKIVINLLTGLGETFLIDHRLRTIPIRKNIKIDFFVILNLLLQRKLSIRAPTFT